MTITAEPAARLGRGRRHCRLEAIERLLLASDNSRLVEGHALPDLIGANAVEIAEALAAAVVAAHGEEWSLGGQSSVLCPRCLASVDEAVAIAEANDPGDGRRQLADVFDEALATKRAGDSTL